MRSVGPLANWDPLPLLLLCLFCYYYCYCLSVCCLLLSLLLFAEAVVALFSSPPSSISHSGRKQHSGKLER